MTPIHTHTSHARGRVLARSAPSSLLACMGGSLVQAKADSRRRFRLARRATSPTASERGEAAGERGRHRGIAVRLPWSTLCRLSQSPLLSSHEQQQQRVGFASAKSRFAPTLGRRTGGASLSLLPSSPGRRSRLGWWSWWPWRGGGVARSGRLVPMADGRLDVQPTASSGPASKQRATPWPAHERARALTRAARLRICAERGTESSATSGVWSFCGAIRQRRASEGGRKGGGRGGGADGVGRCAGC